MAEAKLKFKVKDWNKLCRGLSSARTGLMDDKLEDDELEDRVDTAVLACWRFGEYAINTTLELNKDKPSTKHAHHDRARDLHSQNVLKEDYHQVLEQLNRYRKKADYLSYNATERSTHYAKPDLLKCLDTLERLRAEVEALLKAQGKL